MRQVLTELRQEGLIRDPAPEELEHAAAWDSLPEAEKRSIWEIAQIRGRYDVFSEESLYQAIQDGEVAGHPEWEDCIVWKNKEARLELDEFRDVVMGTTFIGGTPASPNKLRLRWVVLAPPAIARQGELWQNWVGGVMNTEVLKER